MLDPRLFLEILQQNDIRFFTGVPDSGLKHFCACLSDKLSDNHHIISANEGSAIGIAAGYYLSTGYIPLVYMQNSGFGNAVNPLVSLADQQVYGIPVVLMIGWRGMPGTEDQPQHTRMGAVQESLLDLLSIPCRILPEEEKKAASVAEEMVTSARRHSAPSALLVKRGTFQPYPFTAGRTNRPGISRKTAIETLLSVIDEKDLVISTTGYISRELYRCRQEADKNHRNDFLNIGAMGHTSQIALGVALGQKDRRVICLDGDGALLMHMGGAATIGAGNFTNYYHLLLNNGMHESVGGQPTTGNITDFIKVAAGCHYSYARGCSSPDQLKGKLRKFLRNRGPSFLELRTTMSEDSPPPRPENTAGERKANFMRTVSARQKSQADDKR